MDKEGRGTVDFDVLKTAMMALSTFLFPGLTVSHHHNDFFS